MSALRPVLPISLALALLTAGCSSDVQRVTQVVVSVDSDLPPESVLTKVKIDLLKADGEGAIDIPDVFIAPDEHHASKEGPKALPLSFSITQGHESRFRLRVVGFGSLHGEAVRELVRQEVDARFTSHKTQWVHIFLGEICVGKKCDAEAGESCFPTAVEIAGVAAGECGPIEQLSNAVTDLDVSAKDIDPGAQRYDADAHFDAGQDAGMPDQDVDAGDLDADLDTPDADLDTPDGGPEPADTGPRTQDADPQRPDADPYLPDADRKDAEPPKDASEAGAPAPDLCAGNTCQHGSLCVSELSDYSCNCSGTGFTGPRCQMDINECASNPCSASAYPCRESSAPGYICLGQLADWPMPDASPGAKAAPAYDTTTTPGVTIDRTTGLIWQRALPTSYTGCSGTKSVAGDACTAGEAKAYCESLIWAGFDDYRLPSKIELESIVDETRPSPNIDPSAFPGTPADWFWTSSTYLSNPANNWIVGLFFGGSNPFDVTIPERVRCVRGPGSIRPGTPSTRYRVDEAANTVSDARSELVWQRTIVTGTFAWEAAKQQCSGGFRLPTYKELLTLVDPTRTGPAIDPVFRGETVAQTTPSEVFWSSSVYVDGTGSAWDVSFQDGANSGNGSVTMARRVRCVR